MDDSGRIDLARTAPFRLGRLRVEPALRQVTIDTPAAETLEPRVMLVLVALAQAGGAIVSRDRLVEQCWDRRIVGDDSINRVISRLRKLSAEHGGGLFTIETVSKVGYRLIVAEETGAEAVEPAGPDAAELRAGPRRWLRALAVLVAALVVSAIAAGLALMPGGGADDGVVELALSISGTPGAPARAAQILHDEMGTVIAPDRLRLVDAGQAGVYGLAVKVTQLPAEEVVFSQLRSPGGGTPIWTSRQTVRGENTLKDIAAQLVFTAQCVAGGEAAHPPVSRSPVAVSAWAGYCEENTRDQQDNPRQLELLRTAVAAEPRFVEAQVNLAYFLGDETHVAPAPQVAALRAEGLRAADAAARLDPRNPLVPIARSQLTTESDFAGRDAQVRAALAARRTGSGVEYQTQAHFLRSVGRNGAAYDAYQQALAPVPANPINIIFAADALAASGHYDRARPVFEERSRITNAPLTANRLWLDAAIAAHDWTSAKALVATSGMNDPTRAAMDVLVAGLARGDRASVEKAGAQLQQVASDPALLSAVAVTGLAASGRPVAAIAAEGRLFDAKGRGALRLMYSSDFAVARRLPEFAALVTRIGLADFWRRSGNLPDFCLAPDAPPLCATLRARR